MGYTQFTKDNIQHLLEKYNPKDVIDLGDQNDYSQPNLPAPYISGWFEKQGIRYTCIDLNGGNGALIIDLSKELPDASINKSDMVFDCGVSEHISGEGAKFSWEAIYNCWKTKHDLLKVGGVMYSENPKTGNWPLHGQNYYTISFYLELKAMTDYEIIDIGEHPACGNFVDGWNIFCSMRKRSEKFPSLKEFKKLPLYEK